MYRKWGGEVNYLIVFIASKGDRALPKEALIPVVKEGSDNYLLEAKLAAENTPIQTLLL